MDALCVVLVRVGERRFDVSMVCVQGEIAAFFSTSIPTVGPQHVTIVTAYDGRATGEAFVEFG